MTILIPALFACAAPVDEPGRFAGADAVQITSPANGDRVESPFTLEWTAGANVASVELLADGRPADLVRTGTSSMVVDLGAGSWKLELVGLGARGAELSRYPITVRVADPAVESWVTITSPADGAEIPNPVTFAVDTSADVDRVELYADGWLLGEARDGLLTTTFEGTGYARNIEARAWSDDAMVATDAMTFTVAPGTDPPSTDMNERIVRFMAEYPTDGTNGYYWPEGDVWHGTTRDVWYLGERVAEGDPYGRCFCVGLTWEVFMRAFDEADRATGGDGSLNGMSVSDLDTFRVDWFVRELLGAGPADALDHFGLGGRVTDWDAVAPGDFIQFWRHSGSGHNAIFVGWEHDGDGAVIGFRYWSTQSSTDGIGFNEEYFGSSGSRVDPAYFFAARAAAPEDWIGWR